MELSTYEREILTNVVHYTKSDINLLNIFMKQINIDEHAIAIKFLLDMKSDIKEYISSFSSFDDENATDKKINNVLNLFYQYKENNVNSTLLSTQNNDKPYEQVNHPSHYKKYDVEVVDMMEKIWGKQETATWCKLTAFKYRMRLGEKPDNPIQQDLNKESWYLQKYNQLKFELDKNDNESK